MISLEKQFEVEGLRRALLATYAVSVPHVERAVVGRLLASAESQAEVLLLADGHQHERDLVDTGLEGISGPGVHYRLHPIYLNTRYQAFHSKLYVLDHGGGFRVVIGSANLTPFGCRKNAELIECFDFEPGGGGQRVAEDTAAVIDALSALSSTLPDRVTDQLRALAGAIRSIAEQLAPGGPRVLHNADNALWEQISAEIASDAVKRTAIITPYFDRKGKAIRTVVDAWPEAEHLVITRPDGARSLDGSVVASWPTVPALRLYQDLEGESRRLHAKALLVETSDATWVVTGSANLTDPAWLRSVHKGGNFEVVVLRRAKQGVIDALLEPLSLTDGHWPDLIFEPDDDVEAGSARPIYLGGAEFGPRGLSVTARPGEWTGGQLTVRLSTHDTECWSAKIQTVTDEQVVVESSVDAPRLGDRPAVVELLSDVEGEIWSGRTWVTREDLLGRPSRVKRISELAASLSGSGALEVVDYLILLTTNLEPLEGIAETGRPGSRREEEPPAESSSDPDRTFPGIHLIEGGRRRSGHGRTSPFSSSQDSWSMLRALRSLNRRTRGRSRVAGPEVSWGDEDLSEDDDEVVREPTTTERETLARRASRAKELIEEEIQIDLRRPPVPERAELVAERWEAMVHNGLRLDLKKSSEDLEGEIAPVRDGLREAVRALFSLTVDGRAGAEAHPEGWLAWAWAHPDTSDLIESLEDPDNRYGAWLATVLALLVRLRQTSPEAVPDGEERLLSNFEIDALGGLRLALGAGARLRPEDGTPAGNAYRSTLRGLVAVSKGLISESEVEELAQRFMDSSRNPAVVEAAKNVLPLLWQIDEDPRADSAALEDVESSLRPIAADIQRGRNPRIGDVRVREEGTYCADCGMLLPSGDEQHLRSLSPPYAVECPDQVHRLVPLAVRSPVVERIVGEYWPALTDNSDE